MRDNCLRWFGHIQNRHLSAPIRKCDDINLNKAGGRGKAKLTCTYAIEKDVKECEQCDDLGLDHIEWRKRIYVADSVIITKAELSQHRFNSVN